MVFFREEQRFRQWWIWLIVVGIAVMSWWGFIQQIVLKRPFGTNPGPDWLMWLLLVVFGIGFPLMFLRMKLISEVKQASIHIRYWPFVDRDILFTDIERYQARTYNAIKEYGGWGVRKWSDSKVAYNISGNEGVELILKDGCLVMIGSQQAESFAHAIAEASGLQEEVGQPG